MEVHKKSILFLITILAIVTGGYAILKVLHPPAQTVAISSTQANPTSTVTSHPQPATVEYRFSPADLKKYLPNLDSPLLDFVENKQDGKARLFINVIYAIDKDRVFLGGSLDFLNNGNARRSILLRSLDGGKHWAEAMPTAVVSEAEHIVFLGRGEGWTLVQGAGELGTIMPTMLWHTTNFGETWQIAGTIPKGITSGQFPTLKFYSSTHGEVSFVCDTLGFCKGGSYYSILSTQDGGVSWQESYHLALPSVEGDPSYEKLLAAFILPKRAGYGSRVGNCVYVKIQECPSYGQDGSEWQAEYSKDRLGLFVRRRLPFESEWTTYTLPACIEYRDGKIMEVCKDSH